jgi:hypothetical protein
VYRVPGGVAIPAGKLAASVGLGGAFLAAAGIPAQFARIAECLVWLGFCYRTTRATPPASCRRSWGPIGGAAGGAPVPEAIMLDREKVLTVLRRRFPTAQAGELAAATNAIVGLEDEWDEVDSRNLAELIDRLRRGSEFRLLERRDHDAAH